MDLAFTLADAGIPMMLYPMPILGATGAGHAGRHGGRQQRRDPRRDHRHPARLPGRPAHPRRRADRPLHAHRRLLRQRARGPAAARRPGPDGALLRPAGRPRLGRHQGQGAGRAGGLREHAGHDARAVRRRGLPASAPACSTAVTQMSLEELVDRRRGVRHGQRACCAASPSTASTWPSTSSSRWASRATTCSPATRASTCASSGRPGSARPAPTRAGRTAGARVHDRGRAGARRRAARRPSRPTSPPTSAASSTTSSPRPKLTAAGDAPLTAARERARRGRARYDGSGSCSRPRSAVKANRLKSAARDHPAAVGTTLPSPAHAPARRRRPRAPSHPLPERTTTDGLRRRLLRRQARQARAARRRTRSGRSTRRRST